MWDTLRLPLIGNYSLRKIARSFLAVILSVFLWNIATAPTTFAADVSWDGNNLKYQNQTYEPVTASIPEAPAGAQAYTFKQPSQGVAHVIFIPQGADTAREFPATFRSYNFREPNTFTNPQAERTITVDAKGGERTLGTRGAYGEKEGETQCAVQGIGWIICPTMRFLASGMDKIFDLMKGFLEVKTMTLDTTSPLYRMWEVMRGFANIAFVIAFLIIIYSQITSLGFSNYNIKKMLPRLIVAALLVNISYYVCAVAVDISNILGYALQDALVDLRGTVVGANTGANTAVTSWESVTTFIISGGTIAVAGIAGLGVAIASGAGVLSLVFILIPFLLGVLVAVIVALLVLAARQALIIILIAISPLAFIAYLLPNTEKWFEKWKDLFLTMLLLFPIFSVIFGGSQLAGALIIQSATDLNTVLLGMFVQVAPIVITPLLVKFSGGLLGRIAGMVNNPSKGIIDRARNFSNERDQQYRNKRKAQGHMDMEKGRKGLRGSTARFAATRELAKHERATESKKWESVSEAAADKHWKERLYEQDEEGNYVTSGRRSRQKTTDALRNAHAYSYGASMTSQALDSLEEREKEEAKAGLNRGIYESANSEVKQSAQDIAIQSRAAQSAKYVVNRQMSDALETNKALRTAAAGIDGDGEARALASAIKARVDDRSENLKNQELMLDVKNLASADILNLATGKAVVQGIENTPEIREIAIKKIAAGPDIGAIHKLAADIDLSDTSNEFWRTAFVDGLKANSRKPAEFSAGLMDKLGQGVLGGFGEDGLNRAFVEAVKANAFGAKGIAESDKDTLERLASMLERTPGDFDEQAKDNLQRAVFGVVKNDNYRDSLDKRKDAFERIAQAVNADLPDDF